MPELPDAVVYVEALERHVVGHRLEKIRLTSPFLLRSFRPPIESAEGRTVTAARRLGKRIVLALEGDLFLVFHLMIAGRLRWRAPGARPPGRIALALLDFPHGTLLVTEASKKKRASLHLVAGEAALAEHDPGGLEVFDAGVEAFRQALAARNHTIKRALTDPHILSGIGNAYSDEILHRARMSPFKQTRKLADEELARLFDAVREVLAEWTERGRQEVGDGFPEKVTAFREGMAVHGRFRKPCPVCGTAVQRIAYADSEANYCPTCQTGGRLLADRALSQLLGKDWPKTLEELEERKSR